VVSARVNLLTKTEQFDDAAWIASGCTKASVTGPDGIANSAVRVTTTGGGNFYASPSVVPGVYLNSLYLRRISGTGQLSIKTPPGGNTAISDTTEWVRYTASGTVTSAVFSGINFAAAGDVFEVWHPDLRSANQGVGLPAYQRVNTSTDYDSTGFPIYIKPNGSNQFMQTNSINFTATDKMTLWQGVRKLSDAGPSTVFEISATSFSNNGSMALFAPYSGAVYEMFTRGTATYAWQKQGTYTSPITNVVQASLDNSQLTTATQIVAKVNGLTPSTVTNQAGPTSAGNYGNYPAYFYMRAGSSLPFGGNDYGSIARGAASTAAQITAGETYINSKTKAYTP
jgi:hypothetical protein